MDQRNIHHELSLIEHTLLVIKNMNKLSKDMGLSPNERMMMNMSSLFHDLGKLDPSIQTDKGEGQIGYGGHENSSSSIFSRLAESLMLTNEERRFVGDVVSQHMVPHEHLKSQGKETDLDDPETMSKLREFASTNPRWRFVYLHAIADSKSKSEEQSNSSEDPRYRQYMEFMGEVNLPQLLNGHEVMQITGLRGPKVGKVLKKILEHQYQNFGMGNQKIPIEQAREFAIQIAKSFIEPLLNGNEIMQITGKGPGPHIGELHRMLIQEQSNNPAFTRDDAINLVQQMYPRTQPPPSAV
jgi:hypothetical protein